MVRSRKKEKTKGLFEAETMKNAVKMALEGATIREAAAHFNLPFQTVGRYLKKIRDNPDIELEMKARCDVRKIFTDDQERELANFLKDCSKMFYGLTNVETRKLAFEMAEINKIKYPENWKASKMAGKDWLYGFMKRHAELSLIAAEGCSLARAMAFNKHNVDMFFKNYNDVLQRCPELSDPSRIWNIDETKTQTVQRPSRVIAEKGLKQVSKAVSAEKGTLVTTLLFINAAGNTIPPAMVFPRVHFKPHMLIGAPVGTLGLANVTGWMTQPNFVKTIQHFVKYTGCSPTRQMLIICDNHESHMSIEAINLAKKNGVHILTVPPHSTHMMQPLDVGVMKPFQTFYSSAVDSWMSAHPGQTFSIYNVASCVGVAHSRAMMPQTIINALKKTGIFPKDSSVYTEDMFMASKVTDRPLPSPVTPQQAVDRPTSVTSTPQAGPSLVTSPNPTEPSTSAVFQSVTLTPQTGLLLNVSSEQREPSENAERSRQFISPALFRGYPKAKERKKARKPREKGSSKIITSTPEKLLLEERQKKIKEELRLKEEKKKSRMDQKTNKAEKEEGKHKSKKRKLDFNEDETGEVREDIEAENEVSEDEGFTALPDFSVERVDLEDFVLVKFVLDKNDVFYAGKVLKKTENGDFVVKFLRKSSKIKNLFFFPNVDDIGSVAIKDIVMILPSPSNDKGKTKRQQSFFSFAIPTAKYDIR